jgi:hypothetical protein
MPSVNIPNVGVVEFPDEMSHEAIANAIKTQIMPNTPQATAGTAAPSTNIADVLQKSIFSPIDAIMPGSNMANEPSTLVGSAAKGFRSLADIPNQLALSSEMELIAANKEKYGQNFENAPPKEKADILNTVKKASERLTALQSSQKDIKAIEEKYGKDPLANRIDKLEQTPEFQSATPWQQAGMIGKQYLKNIDEFPQYALNVGLSSLPQSIAMAMAAKVGMSAGPTAALIAGGGTSALMEYGQEYVDLREQGFSHEQANNKAMVKSAIIGILDAASIKSAGHIAEQLFDKTAKHTLKETAKEVGKEIPKQAALGAAGEGFGSYASNQPVNPRAVFEEAIGEIAGAPAEAASTYQGKRLEQQAAVKPPTAPPVAPAATTVAPAATPPSSGLVEEGDIEPPVAPSAPKKPEAIPEEINPELKYRAEMRVDQLLSEAEKTGQLNVRELNKLARDLDIAPNKDPMITAVAIMDAIKPTEEITPPAEIKPNEAIAPLDMGENTEYRVVKNDKGWTAVLVDKDTNQMVTATTFPTDKFGDEEGKKKAIEYAQTEQEKAKPYITQEADNAPQEVQAPVTTEEEPTGIQTPEAPVEKLEEPVKTQAEINQERQAAQRSAEQQMDVDKYGKPKLEEALNSDGRIFIDTRDEAGKKTYYAKGIGSIDNKYQVPLDLTPEELRSAKLAEGDIDLSETAEERNAAKKQLEDVLRPAAERAIGLNVAPATASAAELSPEAKAKQDLEDALADLSWLAGKDTRMGMMPEDEQRLLPILTRLMDAAFRLGYHKFKAAAKFVRDTIREKFGKEAADKINLNHLQGAYIGMSGNYPDQATPITEVAGVQKLEELEEETPTAEIKVDLSTPDGKFKIAQAVSQHFLYGNSFGTIVEARKFISDMTGEKIEAGTQSAKQADEAIEVGVVLAAQKIAHKDRKPSEIYDGLVKLYEQQPNLAVRSSTSVREQAYSTPAPLAYIASQLAGINDKTTVYEPTAGNGMLLIAANPKNVTANELNTTRYEMLKKVLPGAEITNNNAVANSVKSIDVVIANPPFGSTGEEFNVYGKTTREIDHAISYKALNEIPVNGRAVLLLGGVRAEGEDARREGYRNPAKRNFYFNLYKDYNVVDHFTVSGNLYTKQGASYPVDVIVIDGKGQSQRALPAAELPQIYSSYEQLKEKLNGPSLVSRGNVSPDRTNVSERGAGAGEPERLGERPVTEGSRPSDEGARPTEGGRPSVSENEPSKRVLPESTGTGTGGGQLESANKPERVNQQNAVPSTGEAKQPVGREGVERNEPKQLGGVSVVSGERVESGLKDRRGEEEETGHQVVYEPHSHAASVGTLVPKAMAQSISQSLARVEDEMGNIDEYVANALEMDPETLKENLSAEQIDALALSIRNAEAGKGFIIGDQTGIGKGRVVAAMIKYAIVNDRIPIFVTQNPPLYAAMIGDLDDIGMTKELGLDTANPKILITNNDEDVPYTLIRKVNGKKEEKKLVLKSASKKMDPILKDMQSKDSIGDYKVIFTTYNQMSDKDSERRLFIDHFSQGNYVILDESHTAGGAGEKAKESDGINRAQFFRGLVDNANGTFFSSATYAKRPDVMDLYSSTDMSLAVENIAELADAIKNGGIPMQQVVANMLTQVGQYIRRERTFAGVAYDTVPTEVNKETAEKMATSMRDILAFSRAIQIIVKQMQKNLDAMGAVGRAKSERTTVQSSTFGSRMHSLIGQMLLSLKTEATVKFAIERLKIGEKPVITVSNTMGSFLQQYADLNDINIGDPINLSFKDMFLNYLEKQRTIKIKKPGQKEGTPYRLTDDDLGPVATAAYSKIKEFINNAGFGAAPMSPIDYMHNALRQAGYKSDEITGRTIVINYQDGIPILSSRSNETEDKSRAIDGFNDGSIDALIINQSGSTGISLHASEKFKDQKKRHMIIAQADPNIDVHMQTLGRVLRTGQVQPPAYSQMMADVPAEMRPAAVLLKKMASLNANTTASRKSAVTAEGVVDFMNDYGGQVAQEYLKDNPEVYADIGGKDTGINLLDDPTEGTEEDIRKFTGYIPVLPIKQQEEIYKDLVERYNDLLERENSMGTNKLEAKAVDLDAETLSSKPITEDKGDPSLFAQPAYMEQVEVKRTVKPYSKDEVEELVLKHLDGMSPPAKASAQREDLRERTRAFGTEQLTKLKESEADPVRIQKFKDDLDSNYNRIQTVLNNYRIGTPISLTNKQNMFVYGVVTDIENKKKTANPAAGSDWKMTIALANGEAKSINLNFSQIGSTYTIKEENIVNYFNPETQQTENIHIKDMFDRNTTVRREKRYMVTGNILAGYAAVKNVGQIMSYTKKDGTTGQGVLMPRNYDFEKEQREAPIRIKTADNAMRFMNEVNGVITSADNVLRISKQGNQYQFNVPSSKKEGGTFFLDNGLLKFTGDFYKSGNTMYVRVYDEAKAKAAIDYIINERGDTLIASSPRDKAKAMFQPKPLENLIPKTTKQKFNEEFRNRFISQAKELKAEKKNLIRKVKEGETNIDVQREMTFLDETLADIEKNIKNLKEPTPRTAESIYNKARKDHFENKIISKEVFDVIQWMYNNAPALLNGLQLSVRAPKTVKEKDAYGGYNSINRLMTLFKGTSGVTDPETLRHELTHTLEEMMTPQVKLDLIKQWAKDVKQAMKKYTDADSQAFLQAVNDYMANPSTATYDEVRRHYKNEALYQFANPSEYWAVNAEKLFTMKMGTSWHRFVLAVKKLIEGMKSVLGFNNQYVLYKTFDDLMTGKYPRDQVKTIRHFFEMGISDPSILENLKKLDETDDLLAKHNRNDAPIHLSNTVMDKLLGGAQEMKNIGAKMKESPRLAVNNMVGNVDRALLATRINTIDFTAGLTAADAERYGRMLEDSEGRATASVAMNQSLKATRIGTQVIMLGKLVFDATNQMYHAVQDKYSMANVLTIKHQLEKRIGVQRAANVIQAYFEAKRSKSINQEYADRAAELEKLKQEQANINTPADRQLNLLLEIEEAQQSLRNIGIALQKVNMTEEAIEDFIKLEKQHPELKEMMKNWSAVNKNMIDMMEHGRIISKQRADTLRDIKDYVPWQRIQDEQSDPHDPIYGSKGVRNIAREAKFKEGKVTADIDDIVDNMLHNVMVATRNSIKNYAANRIAQEYGTRNEKGKLKVFPKEDFSKGIVTILVNGRKINIQIADPLIARSVIGIEHIQIPMNEILSFFANGLRRAITFSGVFQVKQLFMDAPTAALVTGVKNPLKLYGGVFGSFIKGLTQKDPVVELLKSYGIGGYHSSARTAEHQYKQEIGLINKSYMAKATSILDQIADASDFAQRRAVYNRVMKETGGDQRRAILAATNVIDFDKRGDGRTAQFLNRTIAFMNAYAQQIDVLAQALAEPVAGGIEALTGTKITSVSGGLKGLSRQQAITRLAIAGGLLAFTCLLYSMAVGDDDEYKKMDDQTKMRNFVIPRSLMRNIGYDHSLLIPMHTSASYFFKSVPEMLYNKIAKEGTKDAIDNTRLLKALKEGAIDALLGPLGSGPIPTGIKPLVEIGINHDFFTGGKVTPEGMKNLEAFRQYTMNTSQLGKWMSAASSFGTSHRMLNPMEADHIMRGLGGSVSAIAMWGSNLFSGHKPADEERNNPLYGSFIAPEVGRGREDLFYDLQQRSNMAMGTFKDLMTKQHKEEAQQYFKDNVGVIKAYGFTEAAGKALIDVNAQIRRISDLPESKMSAQEKRQQINFYKKKKEDILEQTIKFRLSAGL